MIELIRHEIPFESSGYLRLLGQTFGKEEEELERIQVNGSENEYNLDIAFTAEEDGKVLGTSHITISKTNPRICGLSGVCTDPSVRGKGIGRQLFAALVEEADNNGVEAAFLGTGNPLAASMYASFGFSFLPGTYTMARFHGTGSFRFFEDYGAAPRNVEIRKLDAGMRIGVIPLFIGGETSYLLDSNTGIFNNHFVSQPSTMGLFPRYLDIVHGGGTVWQAVSSDGVTGGVLSVRREEGRTLADFYCLKDFRCRAEELIQKAAGTEPELQFRISAADTFKQETVKKQGYRLFAEETVSYGQLQVLCGLWKK